MSRPRSAIAISAVASPDSAMNVGQHAQMPDAEHLARDLAQADAEGDAVGVGGMWVTMRVASKPSGVRIALTVSE
jgi:hypothetical protein